jgi:hypothetical protein
MLKLNLLALVGVVALGACQPKDSSLSGKKNSKGDEKAAFTLEGKVQALKKGSGLLSCSGVTADATTFVKTSVTFVEGKVDSLKVSAYKNKDNPKDLPNELSPEFLKYQVFAHELKGKLLELELDLEGKKFDIEGYVAMNDKARKVYDLDMQVQDDGEGGKALNATLGYKDSSIGLDLSEAFMGCSVLPLN